MAGAASINLAQQQQSLCHPNGPCFFVVRVWLKSKGNTCGFIPVLESFSWGLSMEVFQEAVLAALQLVLEERKRRGRKGEGSREG